MEDRFVYADNAATTPLDRKVLDKMMPFLTTQYGNASTLYTLGQSSQAAVAEARQNVAEVIGARPEEIYFTGSGTEADNMALHGVLKGRQAAGRRHLITTTFEHPAILNTAKALEKEGFRVTYISVDERGLVRLDELERAITDDTVLVSVMAANNEIGSIQPLHRIGELCRKHGVFFHTDAVQAFAHIPINVEELNIDLLSLSAHKLCGPKGVGALYVRRGVNVAPHITGGGQERGLRSGTENVAGIVGLGEAARLRGSQMEQEMAHVGALSKRLIEGVMNAIPKTVLTGARIGYRLPGTCSFAFEGIEGESLVLRLDNRGICASTGSACSTGSLDPSHVLMAVGLSHEIAHGSLRLTLGVQNTEEDVDYILSILPGVVQDLREMSPVWHG